MNMSGQRGKRVDHACRPSLGRRRMESAWHRQARAFALFSCLLTVGWVGCPSPARGEWSGTVESTLYGTDDAALFSATRRLARDGDPTQPALDDSVFGVGPDMVYEPVLQVTNDFDSTFGQTDLFVRAQGFLFAIHPDFNHLSLGVEATHAFTPETGLLLRYFYLPNLLLGENEERQTGQGLIVEERVTTHFAALVLEQDLSHRWKGRLLGRYGVRLYEDLFSQRDTHFWTIGPHLEWQATDQVELALGYHYERGLSQGRQEPQFNDDVSYVNHYVTGEIGVEFTHAWKVEIGMHYERNDWTSDLPGDLRNGQYETVVQGDLIVTHRLSRVAQLAAGVQRQHRKESFEDNPVTGTNVWLGVEIRF